MPSIAVDAGPLIALFDGGDSRHTDALRFFQRAEAQFVTNVAVNTVILFAVVYYAVRETARAMAAFYYGLGFFVLTSVTIAVASGARMENTPHVVATPFPPRKPSHTG